jgi:adenylosuccinate synthase
VLTRATGEYEELPGWDEDISEAREEADLPQDRARLPRVHRRLRRVPIALVGVGPGREKVIWTEGLASRPRLAGRSVALTRA